MVEKAQLRLIRGGRYGETADPRTNTPPKSPKIIIDLQALDSGQPHWLSNLRAEKPPDPTK